MRPTVALEFNGTNKWVGTFSWHHSLDKVEASFKVVVTDWGSESTCYSFEIGSQKWDLSPKELWQYGNVGKDDYQQAQQRMLYLMYSQTRTALQAATSMPDFDLQDQIKRGDANLEVFNNKVSLRMFDNVWESAVHYTIRKLYIPS